MRAISVLIICFLVFIDIIKAQRGKGPAAWSEYPQSLDSAVASAYFPRWLGNIDSKDFPRHTQLQQLLNHNNDFIFKMSMDLYLDMLRFKAIDTTYEDRKVKNFLFLHDLLFMKYENDQQLLEQKINRCKSTLREACAKFNLEDIYYKDYTIDLNIATAGSPFTLLPFDAKDDYYSAKRIKGEADAYYASHALNVYLTNWVAMNEQAINQTPIDSIIAKAGGALLTMRIYFVVQPLSAFSKDGDFQGITAYGLKALLFTKCPSQPIAVINNQNIGQITEPVVKKCYANALAYLNDSTRYVGYDEVVNAFMIYDEGYSDLGNWFEPVDNCEAAYNYLSGRVDKTSANQITLSLKMMTNYNCSLQPGYEVSFSNRLTGASYSLPIVDAATVQSESSQGYYNLSVNIPTAVLKKMVDTGVNRISFQCSGTPKYRTAKNYVLPYPNKVISRRLNSISSSFDIDAEGHAEKLESLLSKGLQ